MLVQETPIYQASPLLETAYIKAPMLVKAGHIGLEAASIISRVVFSKGYKSYLCFSHGSTL